MCGCFPSLFYINQRSRDNIEMSQLSNRYDWMKASFRGQLIYNLQSSVRKTRIVIKLLSLFLITVRYFVIFSLTIAELY